MKTLRVPIATLLAALLCGIAGCQADASGDRGRVSEQREPPAPANPSVTRPHDHAPPPRTPEN